MWNYQLTIFLLQAHHRTVPSISEASSVVTHHQVPTRLAAPAPVPEVPDLMAFDDTPRAADAESAAAAAVSAPVTQAAPPAESAPMSQHQGSTRKRSSLGPIQELELGLHLLDDDLFGANIGSLSPMQAVPVGVCPLSYLVQVSASAPHWRFIIKK